MSRIARAVVLALLFATALGVSGCAYPRPHPWAFHYPIHTMTGTYQEFPPAAYNTPHEHGQPNPAQD